ncbi:tRNA1(Val) (adenine(37)-N6)-methyltransferase [Indioceanicola profundi]|uniref:tRNA1(Val) (adenine(37)-N6)-methyltransferase n=1 Tax=Indioceanicola profundi TaxID=2220096 RepID=UPI000E6A9BB4|nr:methyltransferase [Indioceanicola profundi]
MREPAVEPMEVTEDSLLGGRVRLLQPRHGYRVAVDPVLLAAAVPARAGESVLDLGCGVGAAALCLATRVPGVRVEGLELQPLNAELAVRNIGLNGLAERVAVHQGDLSVPPAGLAARRFDRIMMNPPFHPAGRHTRSPFAHKAVSHGEGAAGLADWVQAALRLLSARGTLTIIHSAERLDRVVALLEGRFGGISILPLWPRAGEPARRIIVHARRNVRSPSVLLPGLILHAEGQRYSAQAEAVLRDGASISVVSDPNAA